MRVLTFAVASEQMTVFPHPSPKSQAGLRGACRLRFGVHKSVRILRPGPICLGNAPISVEFGEAGIA